MVSRIASLYRNEHLRTLVGTAAAIGLLVVLTDMTLRSSLPFAILMAALLAHDVASDVYDLPNGSNWLFYGVSVVVAGVALAPIFERWWFALVLVVPGLWFVLDGVTAMAYEPDQSRHDYFDDIDDEGSSEAMFRMQTLNLVYQGLRDAQGPRTAEELAGDVDLTESRVEGALDFLVTRDRVEDIEDEDRYRARPPRWGKLTPVVDFLSWLPRRLLRPFRRFAAG